jgi:DMSO reductase anchor subunit
MMEILQALESSGFSMWVKESSTAYVAVLAFHTIGLAFLVGISSATAMRILGVARSIPLEPMQDFFPLMYAGLWINLFTGAVLMCLYPTDYLTEPTIYIKLSAVVIAVVLLRKLHREVFKSAADTEAAADTKQVKQLCCWMIFVWLVATVAGRVMAYTMPTKVQTAAAVLVFAVIALLVGYGIGRSMGWIGSSAANPADTSASE